MYRVPDKKSNVLHVHCYSNLDAISGERMMRREGSVGGVALLHALEPWLVLPAVNLSVMVIVVMLIVVIMMIMILMRMVMMMLMSQISYAGVDG